MGRQIQQAEPLPFLLASLALPCSHVLAGGYNNVVSRPGRALAWTHSLGCLPRMSCLLYVPPRLPTSGCSAALHRPHPSPSPSSSGPDIWPIPTLRYAACPCRQQDACQRGGQSRGAAPVSGHRRYAFSAAFSATQASAAPQAAPKAASNSGSQAPTTQVISVCSAALLCCLVMSWQCSHRVS